MPKKQNPETPEEQSRRFQGDAQRLVDDGELSPTDADRALDKLVRRAKFDGR